LFVKTLLLGGYAVGDRIEYKEPSKRIAGYMASALTGI
jgi:hypothetical protein